MLLENLAPYGICSSLEPELIIKWHHPRLVQNLHSLSLCCHAPLHVLPFIMKVLGVALFLCVGVILAQGQAAPECTYGRGELVQVMLQCRSYQRDNLGHVDPP